MAFDNVLMRLRAVLDADTSGLHRGFDDAKREARNTAEYIDRQQGDIDIGANLKELEAKEKVVRAKVKQIDKMRATVEIGADTSDLDRQSAAMSRQLHGLQRQRGALLEIKNLQETMAKQGVFARTERDLVRANARLRELQTRKEHYQKSGATGWVTRMNKELVQQRQLIRSLQSKKELLAFDIKNATAHAKALEREANEMDKLHAAALKMNAAHDREAAAHAKAAEAARSHGDAMDRTTNSTRNTTVEFERNRRGLISWIMALGALPKNLSQVRIHMGIASLTAKQFVIALGTLGPILMALVGSASALVGVLGSGLVGAAGLAGAAITGLGLGFLGLKAAMGPMKADMDAATSAFDSMQDAIREHGKGSQEAKDAMKEYQQVLKNIDPAAAKAVKSLNKLKAGFQDRTGATRKSMFGLMADGLERANDLMPDFARQTNKFAASLRTAGQNFMEAFDLSEMQSSMNAIMGNFSDALPTLGTALGNIAEGMANIFASFSRHFDNISNGILKWSEGFANANKSGQALNDRIDGMVASAERLVEFFAAAGRVMMTFFGAGADEGRGILDSWTRSLDDLNAAMKTTEGQAGLDEFFDESIALARDFFHAVKDIISVFIEFADAMSPVTTAALKLIEAFADLLDALADFEVLGVAPFKALMTGIGTLMGAGMIGGMLKKIPILGGAMTAAAAAAGAWGRRMVGLPPAVAATTVASQRAAKGMDAVTQAQRSATAGTGRFSQAISRVNPTLGVAASRASVTGSAFRGMGVRGGLAAAGVVFLGDQLGLFNDESKYTEEELKVLLERLGQSAGALDDTAVHIRGARVQMLQLRPALQQGGVAAAQAMVKIRDMAKGMRDEARNVRQDAAVIFGEITPGGEMTGVYQKTFDWLKKIREESGHVADSMAESFGDDWLDQINADLKETGRLTGTWRNRLREAGATESEIDALAGTVGKYGKLMQGANEQTRLAKLHIVNAKRAAEGLDHLPRTMAQAFSQFQRIVGKEQAMEWAIKVDDREALGKVMELARRGKELTSKATVMKILARSETADEAIRKLNRLRSNARKPIDAILRARDQASGKAKEVTQRLNDIPKRTDSRIEARDNASRPADQARRSLLDVVATYVASITDGGTGGMVASIASSVLNFLNQIDGFRAAAEIVISKVFGGNAEGGVAHDVSPLMGYAGGGRNSGRPGKHGGKFSSPTYLVGEEHRPEYVIATNPAYRKANLTYLNLAARSLGQAVVPAFAQGGAYQVGAVPVDKAESNYDRQRSEWEKARNREKRLSERQKDYRKRNSDRDRKNDVPNSVVEMAGAELRRATREREKQERQMKRSKRLMKATKAAHRHREGLEKEITRDQAEMDSARSRGAAGSFERWRDETLRDINHLLDKLRPAYRRAGGQYKTELGTRIAELEAQRERTSRDSMGAEGMLTPAEQARLERLTGQVSYAQTTEGTHDDIAANRSLVSFWEGVLSKLTQGPQSQWNWAAVGEASQSLQGARDAAFNVTGGGIVAAGQVYSNARMDLYRQFGSNVSWQDGAVMGHSQQGGNTVINNWSTPPPDPHTWSQQQAWELQTA